MGRAPCCENNNGLKKGPWTPEEDHKLIDYIHKHGYGNWRLLPKNAGLQRCGKSCRLRWTNYLRPDIKRGRFSFQEEEAIIHLHTILGNKWSAIASKLPGRTDNEVKNYWNTHIRKRLLRMGIDPVTHTLLDISSILTNNNNSSLYATQQLMVNPDEILNSLNNQLLCSTHQKTNPHCFLQNQEDYYSVSQLTPASVSISPLTQAESNVNTSMSFDFDFQQQHHQSHFLCHKDYHVVNELLMDPPPPMSESSTFHSNYYNPNHNFGSVSSSPTPLNSNSTYVNGRSSSTSTEEDETESYIYLSAAALCSHFKY